MCAAQSRFARRYRAFRTDCTHNRDYVIHCIELVRGRPTTLTAKLAVAAECCSKSPRHFRVASAENVSLAV